MRNEAVSELLRGKVLKSTSKDTFICLLVQEAKCAGWKDDEGMMDNVTLFEEKKKRGVQKGKG